ncbi:MAG TPA: DUF4058 family protein [Gemmataceae bacterium]|nr:DUF4058 family protein [Gemmataceae bacterium]
MWLKTYWPKKPGTDRKGYLKKQKEILDSDANLIELDLLREGDRLIIDVNLQSIVDNLKPSPDYLVLVNRAWKRLGRSLGYRIFSFTVLEPLPCIPVPLREGQDEIPLDLQYVFTRAYDSGPYLRGAVDYHKPPTPPLPQEKAAWAQRILKAAKKKAKLQKPAKPKKSIPKRNATH